MLTNILLGIIVLIIFLAAFMLARTLTFAKMGEPAELLDEEIPDGQLSAEHLAGAVRVQTVSQDGAPVNAAAFDELHRYLEQTYPAVHAHLRRQVINGHSLLYIWEGSNPELPGIVLAAHQDVVPVDTSAGAEWEHDPFGGEIADGFVWGRGTLDIKSQITTQMDAVESLLKDGFTPERTIYLAYGHDEEIGGTQGASQIVAWLEGEGRQLAAVVDEGGSIVEGALPGVHVPVALLGRAEKGHLTLELTVNCPPGHSATPPRHTAIGLLAAGLANLEDYPMPPHVSMVRPLFEGVGTAAPFYLQAAFANLWLLGGLVRRKLSAKANTDATMRTTTAVTMISGGLKDNILPRQAKAHVNFRILPGDSIAAVCTHVRKVLDDERIEFEPSTNGAWEPSPLSPVDTPAYFNLVKNIRQVFGNLPVAPYLVLGATDARYYARLCPQVYRFSPYAIHADDLGRMHGINERIPVEALGRMVLFYRQLMRTWGSAAGV